jgi:hypothetical protein
MESLKTVLQDDVAANLMGDRCYLHTDFELVRYSLFGEYGNLTKIYSPISEYETKRVNIFQCDILLE